MNKTIKTMLALVLTSIGLMALICFIGLLSPTVDESVSRLARYINKKGDALKEFIFPENHQYLMRFGTNCKPPYNSHLLTTCDYYFTEVLSTWEDCYKSIDISAEQHKGEKVNISTCTELP